MAKSLMIYGHIVPLWVQCFEIHNESEIRKGTHIKVYEQIIHNHFSIDPLPASTNHAWLYPYIASLMVSI